MSSLSQLLAFAACLASISSTYSLKVLIYPTTIAKSHIMFFAKIGDVLQSAGHECTLYLPEYSFDLKNFEPKTNCRIISAEAADLRFWKSKIYLISYNVM